LNYIPSNNSKSTKKNNGSILILDDDFDITTVIKIALQRHGYNVFGFTDPFLALEHFKINHSTYSDLRMPVCQVFNLSRISNL
jgi:DNA-binding NtrC family response regulator